MKTKNYYFSYAKILLQMNKQDCEAHLKSINNVYGGDEVNNVVEFFSTIIAMGGAK